MCSNQKCPICGSSDVQPLFRKSSPLYQHPLTNYRDQKLIKLEYAICMKCGHSFLVNYDLTELESIYKDKYYTPAIETTSKDDFFGNFYGEYLAPRITRAAQPVFLEVGSSMGGVLALLHGTFPNVRLIGVDPDAENTKFAAKRLMSANASFYVGFFPDALSCASQYPLEGSDQIHIYSRHVIEHVERPSSFFQSQATLGGAMSVTIETPCSDFYSLMASPLDPFHVEHLHVFSFQSLMHLLGQSGLARVNEVAVNQFGDIVIISDVEEGYSSFDGIEDVDFDGFSPVPPALLREKLRAARDSQHKEICEVQGLGKNIVFWGAGSKCSSLLASGIQPLAIFDGNKNKESKFIPGFVNPILHANAETLGRFADCHLVISTSFRDSVLSAVKDARLSFASIR